jgi:hypothetical protein
VKTLIQSRVDVCGVLRSSRVGHGHSEGDLLLPLLRTRLGSYTGRIESVFQFPLHRPAAGTAIENPLNK